MVSRFLEVSPQRKSKMLKSAKDICLNIIWPKLGSLFVRKSYQFIDLLYMLAWRDIVSVYKQSALGILWPIARPLVMLVVLTFLFKEVSKLDSGGIPYPLFVFSGIFCYELFSVMITRISGSLIANKTLVSRVSINRLFFPISSVLTTGLDLVLLSIGLFILMVVYGLSPQVQILGLALAIISLTIVSFSFGLLLATISVWYRDVKVSVAYFLQFFLFMSPVGYSSSNLEDSIGNFLIYNPLTVIIDLVRWSLFNTDINFSRFVIVISAQVLILIFALSFFKKASKNFADVI